MIGFEKLAARKISWSVMVQSGIRKPLMLILASEILYIIAETAKANGLKPYEYFKYVLEEILKHQDDALETYIKDLLPWSTIIPDSCRKQINK